MTGRHADPVDTAEAVVWTEAIRVRALQLMATGQPYGEPEHCPDCRWTWEVVEFLRQIAEANR